MIQVKDKKFEISITREELQKKIATIADVLNKDYSDKAPILIGILNGSFMFAADLVRYLTFPHEIQFGKFSSYSGMETTGKVKELIGLTADLSGRDVIIVEDIVDTGITMSHLVPQIKAKGAKSVEICTLLMKPEKLQVPLDVKYCAIEIENLFVLGYGLDYDGYGRNYPDLYVVVNE